MFWKDGMPFLQRNTDRHFIVPDGAPGRFAIFNRQNQLVAVMIVQKSPAKQAHEAARQVCDNATGDDGPTALETLLVACVQLLGGLLGFAVLLAAGFLKAVFVWVLRPAARSVWAWLTRPPHDEVQHDLPGYIAPQRKEKGDHIVINNYYNF